MPPGNDECVRVMVRCRPMNRKETENGSRNVIEVDKQVNQIIIMSADEQDDNNANRVFTFDSVYGWDSTQREVYDEGAFSLVESVMAS